jgi:hypothetical protein
MNRCERGAENIPSGYYYDCNNDLFMPIQEEINNKWLIIILCIIFIIMCFRN